MASVHLVKNVISRPQPWFRQLLCLRSALIFGRAQYWVVCLQEFGIVTRSRIRVHLRDHRTHREDLCLAAAGCLAGIWAPLPLGVPFFVGMCALTPFVCAYLTQYKKGFYRYILPTYIASYLRCSKTWIKRRCVLCSIHFIWIQLHFISHLALLKRSIMKSVLQTQHVEH